MCVRWRKVERRRREGGNCSVWILAVASLSCKAVCCCLLLSPLSLVSSALLSSQLIEQSMQIAWVNRARDSRQERGWRRVNTSNPLISRHVTPLLLLLLSRQIYYKMKLQHQLRKITKLKKHYVVVTGLLLRVCCVKQFLLPTAV